MFTLTANLTGLTSFTETQIAVASRQYELPAAKRAARWLSKSIGRTVTIERVVVPVEATEDPNNEHAYADLVVAEQAGLA